MSNPARDLSGDDTRAALERHRAEQRARASANSPMALESALADISNEVTEEAIARRAREAKLATGKPG